MDEEKVYYTIILRHDTSTNWMMNNPILALSEYGVEDDTHRVKRGDGQSNWADLPYEHFGLEYLVTFENLLGEVEDSEALKEALNEKVDKKIFTENANGVIENIYITDEEGALGKIGRITKDVVTGGTRNSYLRIISKDNSIQGVYTIDDEGIRLLNLQAYSHINDYEIGKTYYINELCYYDNRLYRAVDEEFIAEESFTKGHWILLASLHSNDIKYNHLRSGLEADNVKDALDELQDLDSQKVKKTNRENKVYGTDEFGQQFLYDKDDLRTVDTVNHVKADLNKNIQIDAGQINYSDAHPEYGSIRKVLDEKVDKTVAGKGAKIVRDIQFDYNEDTGHITLKEDKFSLEDGSSDIEEREIDVVSEVELANNVETLNTRITNEVDTLNTRMDNEVDTLNTRITNEVDTLNDRVTNEVQTLNETIDRKEIALYNKIQEEHDEINTRVDTEVQTLNNTINTKEAALQAQIDTNASEIKRVETERTAEDERIETESKERDAALNTRVDDAITDYTNKINNAVNTLNNTMLRHVDTINNRIDDEIDILNTTINTKESDLYDKIAEEKAALNLRIDNEVETLNNTIDAKEAAMDDKKIDKDLSTLLVTSIMAASQSQEPTVKFIQKNTTTKESIVSHLHFKAEGKIKTRFQDEDHIVIDSSDIDIKDADQDRRLTNAESRLTGHDSNIASLEEHDVNHDRELASHAAQIANHETRLIDLEERADELEAEDVRLDAKIERETTDRTTADAQLSNRIATNALNIANNADNIRTNAESIIELGELLESNIENLTQRKAEKTFAQETSNKVVGKLESDEITANELFNLKETLVSPVDGAATTERIKVISSNNTVIASRNEDGTIDLSTNLDTDVNYFIFIGDSEDEGLNDRIGQSTTIPLTKLENVTTTKGIEIGDIITDIHGVWGRVQSINDEDEEVIAITFNKAADAVWGHIKGDITSQLDLQQQFSDLQQTLQDNINNEESARIATDNTLQDNIDTEKTARETAITAEQTARENADTTLQTNIDKVATDLDTEIINRENADTTLQTNIDAEEAARIAAITAEETARQNADNTKVNKVDEANKVYGTDSNGEQITYDKDSFGKVDTVNGVEADENKNVEITTDNLIYKTPESSEITPTENNLSKVLYYIMSYLYNLTDHVTNMIRPYDPDTYYYPNVGVGLLDPETGNELFTKSLTNFFVTFEREDGVLLMAEVMDCFTADTTKATTYESFMYDVEQGNLKLVGIPEQVGTNGPEDEYSEVMDILNEVEGQTDSYDGLGGTEAEVEGILDDILGNE